MHPNFDHFTQIRLKSSISKSLIINHLQFIFQNFVLKFGFVISLALYLRHVHRNKRRTERTDTLHTKNTVRHTNTSESELIRALGQQYLAYLWSSCNSTA
jgi:hypothetical protein